MEEQDMERELEAVIGMLKLRKSFMWRPSYSEKIKKTPFQIKVLQELFKVTAFPLTATRKDLSLLLSIPPRSIQVWFQNTRQARRRGKAMDVLECQKSNVNSTETDNEDISLKRLLEIISMVRKKMR